ncbi:MAG: 30S ribosomal protein S16 [bacterium]
MLMIRLARRGKTKQPTYRLIISEKTKDTFGSFLEELGSYNPRTNPPTISLKAERIKYWISKGAQASPTIHNLLIDQKVIEGKKVKASKGKAKPAERSEEKAVATPEPATENK